jgi:hypothetical protein
VVSQFIAQLGPLASPRVAVDAVTSRHARLEEITTAIKSKPSKSRSTSDSGRPERQLPLFLFPDL